MFAHVWIQVFEAASVTVAMFCLIQFYLQLKQDLAEHRPFLKVLCIKLVIFFSFWQTIIISFLASANGPLQPTKSLAYPDIRVGIPSTLLCIEMAIFAVMHIFAFPWKPYSIKHSYSDPLNQPGTGYSGGEGKTYQGGPFGLVALADAFNPWDIIKMTARGLRWLFVGVRKRHEDPSYAHHIKADPGYSGPAFAGTGEAATELRSQEDELRGRKGDGFAADDRQGLLRNSGQMGRMPSASPYRGYSMDEYGDSQIDLGRPRPQQPPPGTAVSTFGLDAKPSDFVDEDTTYQPGYQPSSSAAGGAGAGAQGLDGSVHPAYRPGQQRHWNDADSIRPPTYRTTDPHR